MTTALVPLRDPGHGKTRLRGVLSTARRAALASAMLDDVVSALREAALTRIVVAAGGPVAAEVASALDVEVTRDPPSVGGLNAALVASSRRLGPVDELLIVAADLPRLTTNDVSAVLRSDAEVVVSPTRGGGTGGLLRRPGDRIPPAYGPGSAQRHLALAAEVGASSATVETCGFAEDVDTEDDLARLGVGPLGAATSRWFDAWGQRIDATL